MGELLSGARWLRWQARRMPAAVSASAAPISTLACAGEWGRDARKIMAVWHTISKILLVVSLWVSLRLHVSYMS